MFRKVTFRALALRQSFEFFQILQKLTTTRFTGLQSYKKYVLSNELGWIARGQSFDEGLTLETSAF